MTGRVRLLLADDHALMRAGLRALVESWEGVEVVAEADDGREAVALALRHRPDVVLVDIAMKGMDGLRATEEIRRADPAIRVVIVSMHGGRDFIDRALKAGASGYVLKDAAEADLEAAIRAACRGEVYLSPAVAREVVAGYVQGPEGGDKAAGLLTPRQAEVLKLIGEGRNTKEIARLLGLSAKTVEAHRGQIMERLGVHDAANLVLEAVRRGLITLDR